MPHDYVMRLMRIIRRVEGDYRSTGGASYGPVPAPRQDTRPIESWLAVLAELSSTGRRFIFMILQQKSKENFRTSRSCNDARALEPCLRRRCCERIFRSE